MFTAKLMSTASLAGVMTPWCGLGSPDAGVRSFGGLGAPTNLGDMELRPAGPADVVHLLSWVDTWADVVMWTGPYAVSWPLVAEQVAQAQFGDPGAVPWMLVDGDEPVGHARILVGEGGAARYGRVLVAPEARGRGVGRALVTKTVEAALARDDVHRLTLGVFRQNAPARRVYEAVGFGYTGVVNVHLVAGEEWFADEMALQKQS